MKTFFKYNLAILMILAISLFSCKKDKMAETVTDIDGNVYKTVKIGTQTWMAENLKVTHYNTGITQADEISLIEDPIDWGKLSSSAYCWYDNNKNANEKYGALYNWYAASNPNIAPKGWHVPTDAEWTILENYLIANGYNYDGTKVDNKIAKSMAAKTDWNTDDGAGTVGNDLSKNNRSGFTALPAGLRGTNSDFIGLKMFAYWWISTETGMDYGIDRGVFIDENSLWKNGDPKYGGLSIRCIKDY